LLGVQPRGVWLPGIVFEREKVVRRDGVVEIRVMILVVDLKAHEAIAGQDPVTLSKDRADLVSGNVFESICAGDEVDGCIGQTSRARVAGRPVIDAETLQKRSSRLDVWF